MKAEQRQDGFIVTGPMDATAWAPTLAHALDRGVEMVADYDESYGEAEVGDCAGTFTVQRAYRVDLRPAAAIAADAVIDALADGTLGLAWTDDHDLSARLERELVRAFAADIERVIGPWHEAMGGELVEVAVDAGYVYEVSDVSTQTWSRSKSIALLDEVRAACAEVVR